MRAESQVIYSHFSGGAWHRASEESAKPRCTNGTWGIIYCSGSRTFATRESRSHSRPPLPSEEANGDSERSAVHGPAPALAPLLQKPSHWLPPLSLALLQSVLKDADRGTPVKINSDHTPCLSKPSNGFPLGSEQSHSLGVAHKALRDVASATFPISLPRSPAHPSPATPASRLQLQHAKHTLAPSSPSCHLLCLKHTFLTPCKNMAATSYFPLCFSPRAQYNLI